MKLKRFFASFSIVCLIFSVSLVPCFAVIDTVETEVNTDGFVCQVGINQFGDGDWDSFAAPATTMMAAQSIVFASNDAYPICPEFFTLTQFLFENDKTLYWNIYPGYGDEIEEPQITWYTNRLSSNSYLPKFYVGVGYTDPNVSSQAQELTVTRVALGNENLGGVYSNTFRVTIPAKSPNGNYNNNFYCIYPGVSNNSLDMSSVYWSTKPYSEARALLFWVDMFQFVDTTDEGILAILDNILAEAEEANLNLSNILTACNSIITELRSLGADTLLIRECIERLESLSATQLYRLQNIDNNVEAIYYFLTQELKDESDVLSEQAGVIAGNIDNNQQAEDYFQATMQGNYDSLDIDNFSFGGLTGALELIGTVFTDMWNAFGSYSILFTYPLVLGIALLVIGRISKQGGGNSSRNSEHKGGEGGA